MSDLEEFRYASTERIPHEQSEFFESKRALRTSQLSVKQRLKNLLTKNIFVAYQ
jgi:hypothetical protein